VADHHVAARRQRADQLADELIGLLVVLDQVQDRGQKEAVTLAREAARARRTTYLGTEHLLLGLAGQPQERAAQALARCGADPATIRGAVDGRIGAPKGEPLPDETPFTKLALRSLQHALREALLMNQAAVGGEHLALGLLTVGAGVAHDVLVNLGVSYERLRDAVAADGTP
jgi:ATP-dependent Clp protease ATP-binding subunit ClpC